MKIVLSTYVLGHSLTGIGWYTYYLRQGLQTHAAIDQLICIPPPEVEVSQQVSSSKKDSIYSMIRNTIKTLPFTYILQHNYQNFFFTRKARHFSVKNFLYHEPCYIVRPYLGPKVCSVHDLSYIYYPECHPLERVKFLRRYLPRSIKYAHHIITGSHFIREQIINTFQVAPEKVTTVYHGVSPLFRSYSLTDVNPRLERYGLLGKSYLLSVGTLEPRKNLERLIQAFSQLPERQRKQYPLVIVGLKGWSTNTLDKLIQRLLSKNELYCLGYVSDTDLPYLYAGAYAFTYLSIYEGFGLPLLEALASGVPTLSSNTSSMPEVVTDAALLVDPWDIDLITEKLAQLLQDDSLRNTLKRRGPIQAAKFSWSKCVEDTVNVYQKVLACST